MTNDLNMTPQAVRTHIAIFGIRNSGKSSLINALASQNIAIVSDTPGTTTDPVYKSIEIKGLGPCSIIDTAGFDDDNDDLGKLRVSKTKDIVEKTDIALIVLDGQKIEKEFFDDSNDNKKLLENFKIELQWKKNLEEIDTPVITVINKTDKVKNIEKISEYIGNIFNTNTVTVSAKNKENIDELINVIIKSSPKDDDISITGHLVKENDIVLLVMPQDIQAPKGRLILPQVQTIRDLLDNKAIVIASTFDKLEIAIKSLINPPKIIITDSQVFKEVEKIKPKESLLTSFSVLFARYKGDEKIYREGAEYIDRITEKSNILIAESCTHIPLEGDIGRVKIPNMLRKKIGESITIETVSGNDFPKDLKKYDLIIHCGGCMATRKHILNRIRAAKNQNVHITNYGMAIAKLTGTVYV